MTVIKYLLDSSAWLAYFFKETKKIKDIIDSNNFLFTSVISLFEIKKKIIKEHIANERLKNHLNFIKERSIIIKLDINTSECAAELALKEKLHAVDAIIYATALVHKIVLITGDNHFRNKDNVILLK